MFRLLLGLAALVVIVAGIKLAAELVTPFLLSIFLAILCGPPLRWLRQRGVPRGLGMVIVLSIFIVAGVVLTTTVAGTANRFAADWPQTYGPRIQQLTGDWNAAIEARIESQPWLQELKVVDLNGLWSRWMSPDDFMLYFTGALRTLSGTLSRALLILLTTAFILVEATALPEKLRAAFPHSLHGAADLNRIIQQISRYMGIKTWTSLITGGAITVAMLLLNIPYPVLWGLLAFLLNFVPNIGSILAAVPAVLLSFLEHDLQRAVIVAVVYLAVNMFIGNFLEPRWMGRGLGLSTLVVFLSLVFWGWVLGPVGMVISVPLTMAVKIALEGNEESRWVAILMGSPSSVSEPARN
ncbi:MAG: AI-2E family transporter [Planctomycetota bacterium]|nr:MAG: AI-2E family transporter [Planctomycetota bacterium]REJ90121.1 MAG: AI-2E family transporter [Planctomycetota bacterium]